MSAALSAPSGTFISPPAGNQVNEDMRPDPSTGRIASIDVFRGIVMFLMLAEIMHPHRVAEHFPDSEVARWVIFNTTHVEWQGISLHDLIQPGFTFLVGAALPFSLASRRRRGHSTLRILGHAIWRSVFLVALGIILRSLGREETYWTFEDTLTQIGLGYFFAVVIAMLPRAGQYTGLVIILFGFWGAYALSPPPATDFPYEAVGVPSDWQHHYDGFASRWNKNSNLSWRFDLWFLNQFPREDRFDFNRGGYATLSFIPTLGTMLLGLLAANWLREKQRFLIRLILLLTAAGLLMVAGRELAIWGYCPMVKRIWTPSFTLYSGGCCMLWLAGLHLVCDHWRIRFWAYPFLVIGANSILAYVMSWTVAHAIEDMLVRHLGEARFASFGEAWTPLVKGAATLLIIFAALLWLYRRKVFIKI